MAFGRDHRFADNVGEIGPDGEIPIQTDRAKSRTGNETPAHPEESAENPDEKANDREIDRADVRSGDWKKHIIPSDRAAPATTAWSRFQEQPPAR